MSSEIEQVDISEKGRDRSGEVISADRRLFMQLLAFGNCRDTAPLISATTAMLLRRHNAYNSAVEFRGSLRPDK